MLIIIGIINNNSPKLFNYESHENIDQGYITGVESTLCRAKMNMGRQPEKDPQVILIHPDKDNEFCVIAPNKLSQWTKEKAINDVEMLGDLIDIGGYDE